MRMRSLKTFLFLFVLLAIALPASGEEKTEEKFDFFIVVKFSERMLYLYDSQGEEITTYPVAIPRVQKYPLPLEGTMERIEMFPWWYPTEDTRKHYLKKKKIMLPRAIPPGDPKNAMGAAKIIIKFAALTEEPYRIHGNNNPGSIGKKATRGCIRMHNADVTALCDMIKEKTTSVRFES